MSQNKKKKRRSTNSVKTKKLPVYKKWWFIFIMGILTGMVLSPKSALQSNNNQEKNKNKEIVKKENKDKESSDNKKESKFYGIGDSVDVGGVVYTLNSVELTDERNEFEDKKPEHVIKVVYTMKNTTDSDVPVGADVSAYGPDTKKIDSYANENTLGSVAPDKSIDVTQHFALDSLGEVELQFAPLVSLKDTANFKVTVK